MNTIETRQIGKLILNEETPQRANRVEHYLIPAYQRGYRWTTELHVKVLLEDIDDFLSKKRASDEFYCLQPIVVTPQKDCEGNRRWEVIDGQQRLTTLYLILKYLGKRKYEIIFDKREKSTIFLRDLSPTTFEHSNPDFHFMSAAYDYISKWFEQKEEYDINYGDRFTTVLMDSVQVIWYEIQLTGTTFEEKETEKIDTFNRLNIGKIPLEDAELVRALLMSKITESSHRELLLRQAEFSNEWYEIEHFLQNKQVWRFLTKKIYSNHIQLIFELMSGNKNTLNYSTYKWFENEFVKCESPSNKAKELWNEAKTYISKLRYWYNNRCAYHYIGFLLAANLVTLEELVSESNKKKSEFKLFLHNKIAEFLNSIDLERLDYTNKYEDIKKVLLLFNVLTCNEQIDTPQNRFPFNLYNEINETKKWSLEHIHAQQSEDPLQRDDIIRKWIDDTLSSLKRVETINKGKDPETDNDVVIDVKYLKEELLNIKTENPIDNEEFNNLRVRIIEAFDSNSKHWLDNMALLSRPDNSSLNNAIFPVKRDRIIELERQGHFIPPCTRNVFLKLYSRADNQPYFWSANDKEEYLAAIYDMFNSFKNEQL